MAIVTANAATQPRLSLAALTSHRALQCAPARRHRDRARRWCHAVPCGDRVFGQFWSQPLRFGTFAEVCVVQAVPAFGAIDHVRVPEGGMLLVIGATGGVGTFRGAGRRGPRHQGHRDGVRPAR